MDRESTTGRVPHVSNDGEMEQRVMTVGEVKAFLNNYGIPDDRGCLSKQSTKRPVNGTSDRRACKHSGIHARARK
jgi:hypothetical protein